MPTKLKPCKKCPALVRGASITGHCGPCWSKVRADKAASIAEARVAAEPKQLISADREKTRVAQELSTLKKKYDECVRIIDRQEHELSALDNLTAKGVTTFKIEPRQGSGKSEGTVVVPASDWHMEERVNPATINGLNEHNLEFAKARAVKFFQRGLRLTRLLQQDLTIDHMVMPLLGDFISNDIHEDFPENNDLPPMLAIVEAGNSIASGIEFLLNHSKLQLTFPCHSGNHARTTHKVRVAMENGHSIEFLMYRHLAAYFRSEKRVQFIIPEGYHSYMEIYGKTLRFHHGHEINYAGGVGGIYIPVNKAIAQWNKAKRADLDVFGHFHQARDGGNFISNGSSIGYNAYAQSIKADFDVPKQQLFLMDKKRGRTCAWPIFVS